MTKPIYVLNGPNLNLLGSRELQVYGSETLDDVRARCERKAAKLGFAIDFRQSNHEGELVAWIQGESGWNDRQCRRVHPQLDRHA
jgi:3-dehydroquinate dehydratase II